MTNKRSIKMILSFMFLIGCIAGAVSWYVPVKATAGTVLTGPGNTRAAAVHKYDHIVVVVEENHSYNQIVNNKMAPFMNSLISKGALFTDAHGITHPSQPNYLTLFSGSTQGIKNDACKGPFGTENLASQLKARHLTFTGYSEDLPSVGFSKCYYGGYARKHNPWAQFTNVPAAWNRPLTDFPKDFSKLPTVSFVVPALQNDMHDGTVKDADGWLKSNLGAYASWSRDHNSLLIVTWDEDNFAKPNHIPLFFYGAGILPGKYSGNVSHYRVLRTMEDMYGLSPLGESKNVSAITNIWKH
ncbi:alkaline phosphatase family protein [Paenibacillus tuaregi]|uniref:alkaline phosphatase family protein n=1 Tax=Paenibacillus tuaregi TaxID=1816681 RepID=UPI000ABE574E|nr:alkaline phosphatase family protein [Paenibacillus tuaregi]